MQISKAKSKKEILVIDDDSDTQLWLKKILEGAGYHCRFAANVDEGIQQVKEHASHLIILDYRLENEIGSLEVGKQADLILLDASKPHYFPHHNPVSSIAYSAQAADVSTVLVNGKVLMENYELKTIDVEETVREAERMAFDLVSRAKES